MKSPRSIRIAALVAAAMTTFVQVQSLALLGLPPAQDAPLLAQAPQATPADR